MGELLRRIEVLVTLSRFYARIKPLQGRTPLRRIVITNIKDYFYCTGDRATVQDLLPGIRV